MTEPRLARAVAAGALAILLVGGAAPAAAADAPPTLPYPPLGSCVPASPVEFRGAAWPTARMHPGAAWALSRGAGTTVAVLDSGVSPTARGLEGAVRGGRDVVADATARSDCLGRGTALAALAAGRPVPGNGLVGVAPAAAVAPVVVIDAQRRLTAAALAAGLREATRARVDVILVGAGITADDADVRSAVDAATAAGVVVVAPISDRANGSAGGPPTPWYPAAYPDVLAVGGIDAQGRPTEPSSPASGLDLLAPSVGAIVPAPVGSGHYTVGGPAIAAAFVAGTVALVRGYRPDLTPAQVRARLLATAEWAPPAANGTPAAGVVDPYAALAQLAPEQALIPVTAAVVPVEVAPVPAPDPAVARALGAVAALAVVTGTAAAILVLARSALRRRRSAKGQIGSIITTASVAAPVRPRSTGSSASASMRSPRPRSAR